MKKSIPIKPFWYSDILVIPKVVTIITTVNKQGIVNAAPYSLFVPYDIMHNRPQVMVGMRKFPIPIKILWQPESLWLTFHQQIILMT